MDSDQVFDHRKFDGGALQGGTAPTDTPRTNARCKKIRHEALGLGYVADELQHWAEDLERELSAARAEADELAKVLPYEAREAVAEALYEFMSDLSEDCYCAGWIYGNEFYLWDVLIDPSADRSYGIGSISDAQINALRALSGLCDGWWMWRDKVGREFMSLEAWKAHVSRVRAEMEKEKGNG